MSLQILPWVHLIAGMKGYAQAWCLRTHAAVSAEGPILNLQRMQQGQLKELVGRLTGVCVTINKASTI